MTSAERALISDLWLRDSVALVFAALGIAPDDAASVADALVEADLRGTPSHGVLLVPMYVRRILAGSVAKQATGTIVSELGAVATLDAGHGLGILTGDQAMRLAIDKAQNYGVGAVAVRKAFHFGGAFRYVQTAAKAGFIGIATANTRPLMPAPGGAKAVVGNNPLAIGVPFDGAVIILDMALSEAALGKIRLAAQEGLDIPPTWATDRHGVRTTDPETALAGLLLPAAGAKGYGLAFMLDILTGVLAAGRYGVGVRGLYGDPAEPNDCAHFFVAINPGSFGDPETFANGVRGLAEQVISSPTAPGVSQVYLPGQIEAEHRRDAVDKGVSVPYPVLRALLDTANSIGVELSDPTTDHSRPLT